MKLKKGVDYARIRYGRVAEWLKAHDSKSCDGVDPFGGSNPLSSARYNKMKKIRIRTFGANPFYDIIGR